MIPHPINHQCLAPVQSLVIRLEICSLRVGATLFGIPVNDILEIVGNTTPQPVPLAARFIGGLIHYRGDVLTTVSLRQLLGMPQECGPQDILVLEGSDGCFGLQVDSVTEILIVSATDYEPNPSTLDLRHQALFSGAYKLENSLLVMLDSEKLDPMRLLEEGACSTPRTGGRAAVEGKSP